MPPDHGAGASNGLTSGQHATASAGLDPQRTNRLRLFSRRQWLTTSTWLCTAGVAAV